MQPFLEIQAHAAHGAELLDEHYPGWADEIDTVALDIKDCFHCVLGQLYVRTRAEEPTPYEKGLRTLFPVTSPDEKHDLAIHYGFHSPHTVENYETNFLLKAAWIDLIQARRSSSSREDETGD